MHTEESDPYSLGTNLFTPALIAASITTACSPSAVIGKRLTTASCPLKASVGELKLKSLLTTLVPRGKVEDESKRLMSVILREEERRVGRMAVPRLPLAWGSC